MTNNFDLDFDFDSISAISSNGININQFKNLGARRQRKDSQGSSGSENNLNQHGIIVGPQSEQSSAVVPRMNPKAYSLVCNKNSDSNSYYVEHLADFTVSMSSAVLTVDDAVRKLKLMDYKGNLWSQEMQMDITTTAILLVDLETGELIERFPFNCFSQAQVIMSNDYHFDNILALVIQDSSQRKPQIYLFQCEQAPADEILNDIDQAFHNYRQLPKAVRKNKKAFSDSASLSEMSDGRHRLNKTTGLFVHKEGFDDMFGKPWGSASEPATTKNIDTMQRKKLEYITAHEAAAQALENKAHTNELYRKHDPPSKLNRGASEPKIEPTMAPSDQFELLAAKVERDIQMLNHCFDDIDYFVGRLRKASDAFNDLSKRKNDKKKMGDGIAVIRAKAPHQADYVDALSKIKLSLNLVAKLQNNIYEPSASDLVHCILKPLFMITESLRKTKVVQNVVSPLFSFQTLELLDTCLSDENRNIFNSLGTAWNMPKTTWAKERFVPPYKPSFRDGWEPPELPEVLTRPQTSDSETDLANKKSSKPLNASIEMPSPQKPENTNLEKKLSVIKANLKSGAQSNQTEERDHSSKQNLPESINVVSPPNFSTHPGYEAPSPPKPPIKTPNANAVTLGKALVAKFDFVARHYKELTVREGEVLEILDNSKQWWVAKNASGQTGFVPNTIFSANVSIQLPPNDLVVNGGLPPTFHHHMHEVVEKVNQEKENEIMGAIQNGKTQKPTPTSIDYSAVASPPPPPPPPVATITSVPPPPAAPAAPPPPLPPNAPAPPPPPPICPANQPTNFKKPSQKAAPRKVISAGPDLFQDELIKRIKSGNPFRKIKKRDELKEELTAKITSDNKVSKPTRRVDRPADVTVASNAAEIKNWLHMKGFSPRTVECLGVLNGAQLFTLSKDEIMDICPTDGQRVFSQITVQKSRRNIIYSKMNSQAELPTIVNDFVNKHPPPSFLPPTPPDSSDSCSSFKDPVPLTHL